MIEGLFVIGLSQMTSFSLVVNVHLMLLYNLSGCFIKAF